MRLELFNKHVEKLSAPLYRFAYWKIGNRELAEDAVQDTFMKMWLMKSKLNDYERLDYLAYKILRNICVDAFRKKRNESINIDLVKHILPDNSSTPEKKIELNEKIQQVENMISKLPEKQQLIFYLKNFEGKKIVEISEMLNIKPNTIEVNLSRVRKKINEKFKNNG